MAGFNDRQSVVDPSYAAHPTSRSARADADSPASSVSGSDKENADRRSARSSLGKRKSTAVAMSSQAPASTASKRRRLGGGSQALTGQQSDRLFYDPDQDEAIKRETTKKLRELNANLNDSPAEFLQRGNRGIQKTITEADDLYENVKQTSVAAIDSRLLVNVGDLAYKKINTMTLGDSSTGIDVDDFLTKCIHYMKASPALSTTRPPFTQRRRRRPQQAENDDSEDEEFDEEAAELDWSYLGRTLCFPANNRPCLSSFLLGPLSVQKKVRQQTQRKATQRTQQPTGPATRPVELDQEALDKQESASLTHICSEIAKLLARAQEQGETLVSQEVQDMEQDGIEPSDDDVKKMMRKHNIADNGGVPLFSFCVNPKSFGQTVENFFYVSFLVKEGKVGLDFDSDGLPTLGMVEQRSVEARQESVRNQAVFTLDFETWEDIVQSFGIRKCVIPHRKQEEWELDDGVIVSRSQAVLPERRRDESPPPLSGPGVNTDDETTEDDDLYGPA